MQITFKTPDIIIIHKKRNQAKNYALMLLSNFYRNMQTNIITSFENNHRFDLLNHKNELESILKLIYQYVFLEYPYIIDNYYITEKTKKDKIIIDNSQEIKKQFQSYKNEFIDKLLNIRVDLIFTNLVKKLNDMWETSNKESMENIQKIQQRVSEITNIMNANAGISILQVIRNMNKLSNEREILRNKLLNTKQIQKQFFINKYKKEIIENRSLLQGENEVNNIYNKVQLVEHNIMKNNANNIIINNKKTQLQEMYKRWNSFLDKKTRNTHAQTDGQVVKESARFTIYNPKTLQPEYALCPMGDGLSIENSINCRCSVEYFYILKMLDS